MKENEETLDMETPVVLVYNIQSCQNSMQHVRAVLFVKNELQFSCTWSFIGVV